MHRSHPGGIWVGTKTFVMGLWKPDASIWFEVSTKPFDQSIAGLAFFLLISQ